MALLWFLSLLALTYAASSDVVDLGYAKYQGHRTPHGVSEWLGMRYAAPPVGELRFEAPQDPVTVSSIQAAPTHKPLCIKVASATNQPVPQGSSEDCLFLNVFAPTDATANDRNLPVYFFIQGGGFASLSNPNYNGSGLVQASGNNIIVVTFNYRVGPYGFLASKEVESGASLNNGLKDQRKALEWVKKHISKFGGNPDHVVIGGDSAGGASITLQLSAYGGRNDNLFVAAAAESQSFGPVFNVSESQFAYDHLVKTTGCNGKEDTLACLRNLDIATLQSKNVVTRYPGAPKDPLYLYNPTIDGELVQDQTYLLFENGKFIKVPVIFGDDTDEGTIFLSQNTTSPAQVDDFIKSQFPSIGTTHLSKINDMYLTPDKQQTFPSNPLAGPYWRPGSNAYGELRYICPGIHMSTIYARANVPSWNYHYAVVDPDDEMNGKGTSHTVEVNAIWGPEYVTTKPPKSYTTSNKNIVPVMQGYWTSFVRTLDPNTYRYPGSPGWVEWGGGDDSYKRIFIRTNQTRMERVPADQQDRCNYLIGIGSDLKQ